GWSVRCATTSQCADPEVLGAIDPLRRQGAPRMADPRGLRLAWGAMTPGELAKLLDDDRPAVQNRAIHELARVGAGAVSALDVVLNTSRSADARRNAVWALTRIATAPAREGVRSALNARDA